MGPMPARNGCLYTGTVRGAALPPGAAAHHGTQRQRPTLKPIAQMRSVSSALKRTDSIVA